MTSGVRYSAVTGILLVVAVANGCSNTPATSITYSYDPTFSFPDSKTYAWVKPKSTYGSNALVEANVRFLTDRDFERRGLRLTADKPALLAWIGYEPGYYYGYYYDYYSSSAYDLRLLTLNVARAEDNQLVWQGRALGNIKTDASSGELKKAVEGMLANFPPK
jgi:hypothetical protein